MPLLFIGRLVRDVREGGELFGYGSDFTLVFVFFIEVALDFGEQQFSAFVTKAVK